MMNNEKRIPIGDPYGSVKAAMSRGVTHYYEDGSKTQARKQAILRREQEEKENGTGKRHVSC